MSSDHAHTLRIKSTHKESQCEFVVINVADFDPAKGHELYEEAPVVVPKEPAVEAPAAPAIPKRTKR